MAASHHHDGSAFASNGQEQYRQLQHPPSPKPQHRRGYQACDPCRKRKVKCDLGSVDNPRPPPCVRCRRESKRCEFSATRRKRKPSGAGDDVADGVLRRDKRMMVGEVVSSNDSPSDTSSYSHQQDLSAFDGSTNSHNSSSNRNDQYPSGALSRQKWPEDSSTTGDQLHSNQRYTAGAPTSSQAKDARNPPLPMYPVGERRTGMATSFNFKGGQPMMNRTAVELLSPAISNSHDALHLLSEAAGRTEDLNRQSLENRHAGRRSTSSFNSPISPLAHTATPRSIGESLSRAPRSGTVSGGNYYQDGGSGSVEAQFPDARARTGSSSSFQDPVHADAVKVWSRLRFVRAGWLTVEEAMAYVAYYYEHLAPLSPIVIPDFSHPSTHRTLLADEPVLAVTILTTASRHMKPKGDGAYTRAFYIHDRLWSYLRGMVERVFWGQEKFGGSGAGISRPRSLDIVGKFNSKGSLRSLGTVEALLILTDWHPRNLHFPPGDDENALLDMDAHTLAHDGEHTGSRSSSSTVEGRLAFQKWLEPAWRSDRMSWMLLSTAQALAFELGVFDQKNDFRTANESPSEQKRKRRLRRLILVYVTQSSGRLGIPSMLPLPQWGNHDTLTPLVDKKDDDDATVDAMHDCWIGISKIMYQSNQLLFASMDQTSELIRTGRYREQIDRFIPFLKDFRRSLDNIDLAAAMRHILVIEYEYTRLYINSLALQAVVDRWTTMAHEAATGQTQQGKPNTGSGWFRTLMELYRVNEPYIQEVVDASRRILTTVLEGLVPGDHLQHAPVRTCFRILSGMIFILKTFTLGAKEDDVRVSLDLQDRTVEALRTCVVDDVHISHTIARLLELLTTSIRTRFLRFAPLDRAGDGDGTLGPESRNQSPQVNDGGRREASNQQWPPASSATQTAHNLTSYVDGVRDATTGMGTGTGTARDPLASIPAQPINSTNINVSFMPPPPSVYYNYSDPNSTPPAGDLEGSNVAAQSVADHASGGLPDWFALPLDQFFNSSTAVVDQGLGGTGPMVGEFDMLEVLLNEQYDGTGDVVDSGSNHGLTQYL